MNTRKINSFSIVKEKTDLYSKKINSSLLAADYVRQFYSSDLEVYESFFCLFLDNSKNVTGYVKIGQGGLTSTIADPKLILKYTVESLACGVIMVHNHPSGNLNPSESDCKLTRNIQDLLKLLQVDMVDHIILTSENYYSFADNGNI